MGLNVFVLFTGIGLGSLLFGEILQHGFTTALLAFSAIQFSAGLMAFALFRREIRSTPADSPKQPPISSV